MCIFTFLLTVKAILILARAGVDILTSELDLVCCMVAEDGIQYIQAPADSTLLFLGV